MKTHKFKVGDLVVVAKYPADTVSGDHPDVERMFKSKHVMVVKEIDKDEDFWCGHPGNTTCKNHIRVGPYIPGSEFGSWHFHPTDIELVSRFNKPKRINAWKLGK